MMHQKNPQCERDREARQAKGGLHGLGQASDKVVSDLRGPYNKEKEVLDWAKQIASIFFLRVF
jgi:hypothetical protein